MKNDMAKKVRRAAGAPATKTRVTLSPRDKKTMDSLVGLADRVV